MNTLFVGVSTKDAMYVSDIMKALLVLNKKIDHYEKETIDEQLKSNLCNIRQITTNQYQQLLEVLNNG